MHDDGKLQELNFFFGLSFKSSNVEIHVSAFVVTRRYLCMSLLGVLNEKKSRRNLPFAFAVNLVENQEQKFGVHLQKRLASATVPRTLPTSIAFKGF